MEVNVQNPEADKDELIKSFQEIFDPKLTTMEARLMFDEKLTSIDNIMKTSNICTDSTLPDSCLDNNRNNTDEIKKNDIEFLAHILRKIDVNSQPESINRLGRPNETNRRTIKIVMKTDQENVMANLRKLKGTEEEFNKIRVTHDYTNNERDLIRRTVSGGVAEEKSEGNTERVYRVRGDPKKWSSIGLLSKEMTIKASMYNGNKF